MSAPDDGRCLLSSNKEERQALVQSHATRDTHSERSLL